MEAWGVVQGNLWFEGINKFIPSALVANNLQTMFDIEPSQYNVKVKSPTVILVWDSRPGGAFVRRSSYAMRRACTSTM